MYIYIYIPLNHHVFSDNANKKTWFFDGAQDPPPSRQALRVTPRKVAAHAPRPGAPGARSALLAVPARAR